MQECDRARALLAGVQVAFPEVAQLVRTVQLSHKILFRKGAFIAELAQTGAQHVLTLEREVYLKP